MVSRLYTAISFISSLPSIFVVLVERYTDQWKPHDQKEPGQGLLTASWERSLQIMQKHTFAVLASLVSTTFSMLATGTAVDWWTDVPTKNTLVLLALRVLIFLACIGFALRVTGEFIWPTSFDDEKGGNIEMKLDCVTNDCEKANNVSMAHYELDGFLPTPA
jgi:hypothetical protein